MTIEIIIYILLIHFLADFAMQTHEQAIKKSSDDLFLLYHVLIYSGIWLVACLVFMPFTKAILFALITGMAHFATDWVTSRINKKFFDKQNFHDGFVGVGADQLLHYIQLFYTFNLFYD